MKAYLGITGTLFALLAAWHVVELVTHIQRGESDPGTIVMIVVVTALAGGLAIWAFRLLRALPRS